MRTILGRFIVHKLDKICIPPGEVETITVCFCDNRRPLLTEKLLSQAGMMDPQLNGGKLHLTVRGCQNLDARLWGRENVKCNKSEAILNS